MSKQLIHIILLSFLFTGVSSCLKSKPDIEVVNSFLVKDSQVMIQANANIIVIQGDIFTTKEFYLYYFNSQKGKHLVFKLDKKEQKFDKFFEFDVSAGQEAARLIDCNFDSIKDLVIKEDAGGNADDEIRIIFLKKEKSLLIVDQNLSYPIFDYRDNTILSRSQNTNDSVITIDRYRWEADRLRLVDKKLISDTLYIKQYGNLVEN